MNLHGIELWAANRSAFPGPRFHLVGVKIHTRPDGGAAVVLTYTRYPSEERQQVHLEMEPAAYRLLREHFTLGK